MLKLQDICLEVLLAKLHIKIGTITAVEVVPDADKLLKLTVDVGPDCNYSPTEVVVVESRPRFELLFLSPPFALLTTIEIKVLDAGLGYYDYSLDNGPFQDFVR